MKRIISTQGLLYGPFTEPNISTAIRERVDPKLEQCYNNCSADGDIHIEATFSYELFDGQVTTMLLSYTVDHPTPQRLEDFRATCESFYGVYGFLVDDEDTAPTVFFKATDIYDKASLIHALDYQSVSLEAVMCAVDSSLSEKEAIYSPSGTHLVQLPDVPRYRIREGTLFICPLATRHCKRLRQLDIPMGLLNHQEALSDYPYPLKVKEWHTHYDGTPDDDEVDYDYNDTVFDNHDVGYSPDGKTLILCRHTFSDIRYEVPDGVEEIDDCAFVACRHYLELSIPRSVRTIGDSLFGNGGIIKIRDVQSG